MINLHNLFFGVHWIGLVLGFGGASLSAFLMFLTEKNQGDILKNGKLVKKISPFSFLGLILLILSGIGLSATGGGFNNPLWLTIKHILAVIIIFDALMIHYKYMPNYFRLAPKSGKPSEEFIKNYKRMKKLGIISMSSWVLIIFFSLVF